MTVLLKFRFATAAAALVMLMSAQAGASSTLAKTSNKTASASRDDARTLSRTNVPILGARSVAIADVGISNGFSHLDVVHLTFRPAMRQPSGRVWSAVAAHQIWSDVRAMLQRLNGFRERRGLRTLVLDPRLCKVARQHALDMVARRYFSHESPEGLSPFDRMARAGLRYRFAGENMALDQDERNASRALWGSSEHRSNILEPKYCKVGIAAVRRGESEIFVQDFSD